MATRDTYPAVMADSGSLLPGLALALVSAVLDQRAMREDLGVTETGPARSLARIDIQDLLRLAALAAEAEAGLFARRPRGAGAKQAGGSAGRCARVPPCITWTAGPASRISTSGPSTRRTRRTFPYRWRGTADFGPSKFGRYPGDPPSFTGRRVDMLGRSLNVPSDAEPVMVLRGYLSAARTDSASELAAKAVVLISPERLVGKVAWPHTSAPR